ncbi:hypothetical protein HDU97_007539 [Phlyctochytrium planicorne]|nr:hypothetical protein HDU97_007539 [Phlyctochytrium planicorne]
MHADVNDDVFPTSPMPQIIRTSTSSANSTSVLTSPSLAPRRWPSIDPTASSPDSVTMQRNSFSGRSSIDVPMPPAANNVNGRASLTTGRRASRVHWDEKQTYNDEREDYYSKSSGGNRTIKIVLMPVDGKDKRHNHRSSGGAAYYVVVILGMVFFLYVPMAFIIGILRSSQFHQQQQLQPFENAAAGDSVVFPVHNNANGNPIIIKSPSASATAPSSSPFIDDAGKTQCRQPAPFKPPSHPSLDATYTALYDRFANGGLNKTYAGAIADRLAGLVRIDTTAYDDMNLAIIPEDEAKPDPDPRRKEGMVKIREYIVKTWPLVHEKFEMNVVNRYGLLYRWKGSDETKRPILLTAHLDVVPVPEETLSKWTFPPFGGTVAKGKVWGRGSHDCKAQVVEIMDAMENLISSSFSPQRTILIAFGFDEEIGGDQGAKFLSAHLRKWGYGPSPLTPIAFLLDEGSGINRKNLGLNSPLPEPDGKTAFAAVSVAEKGYMDINVIVNVAGGHSSAPPKHTGIGIASLAVVALEEGGAEEGGVRVEMPLVKEMGCWEKFGAIEDKGLKEVVKDVILGKGGEARRKELAGKIGVMGDRWKALLGTTQAVDVVKGGVKVNSLPEQVTVTINYRISAPSSVHQTEERIVNLLKPVASNLNLTIVQKPASPRPPLTLSPSDANASRGTITIETLPGSFEPSPVASDATREFELVAATIRRTLRLAEKEEVVVHPSEALGNTDTIHYVGLVGGGKLGVGANVYRFSPLSDFGDQGVHTVDENVPVEQIVAASGFFYELVRGVDGDDGIL